MKKTRFTETQIVKAIQEHENGRDAKDVCRELGISTAAFYQWDYNCSRSHASLGYVPPAEYSKIQIPFEKS